MLNDRIWLAIRDLSGQELQTVRRRHFTVGVESFNVVVVTPASTGIPRSIPRSEFDQVLDLDLSPDQLSPGMLRSTYTQNGSYILSILQELQRRGLL